MLLRAASIKAPSLSLLILCLLSHYPNENHGEGDEGAQEDKKNRGEKKSIGIQSVFAEVYRIKPLLHLLKNDACNLATITDRRCSLG
jgi:hypothetical protein